MSVGQPANIKLMRFGRLAYEAFGHMPYHVGSSLKSKTGWRDVDVRVLLPDDEFAAMFPGLDDPGRAQLHPRMEAICLVWSEFGCLYTGLPIDFQLQQQSYANEQYSGHDGCLRSAIGIDLAQHYRERAASSRDLERSA